MENALALKEPAEKPVRLAEREQAPNSKKPFWSSKIHGIPQGYSTARPSTAPKHAALQAGGLTTRPKSANQQALDRRDTALGMKEKEDAARLVPLEVLAQIEHKLKAAVIQCTPEYEKKQTILIRAFQTFDQAGRGTIPLDAFQKALACFQIETSEAECRALFNKYGQDQQRRMPYEVFTQALFASENRMLAWTGIKQGPFQAAVSTKGKRQEERVHGKVQPLQAGPGHSKTGIYPPSDWNPELLRRSRKPPEHQLELQHVYGYAGRTKYANSASKTPRKDIDPLSSDVSPNLFFASSGEVVYFTAAVGVVHDWYQPHQAGQQRRNSQRFFQSHDDDILCLAMDPSRNYAATGQTAPLKRTKGGPCKPTVSVWDVHSMQELVQLEHSPKKQEDGSEISMGGVQAVAFSSRGDLLVTCCRDPYGTVSVWKWRHATLLCATANSVNRVPPSVFGTAWNGMGSAQLQKGNVDFATYGAGHIMFWARTEKGSAEVADPAQNFLWDKCAGSFRGEATPDDAPQNVLCCEFFEGAEGEMRAVTGVGSGDLLVWRNVAPRDNPGVVEMKVFKKVTWIDPKDTTKTPRSAHMHNLMTCRLRKRREGGKVVTELLTGGGGGRIKFWRIDKDNFAHDPVKDVIQLPPEQKGGASPGIKALDSFPGTGEIIVGTDRCEVLFVEVKDLKDKRFEKENGKATGGKTTAKLMVQGHKARVEALAAHPTQPGLFATGSHGDRVNLWSAESREIVAICTLKGQEVTCVAFNPDGTRLAVGTHEGRVIILVCEDPDKPSSGGASLNPLHRLKLEQRALKSPPDKQVLEQRGLKDKTMPSIEDSVSPGSFGGEPVAQMSYSPDGRTLAVASHDQCIYLYNAENDNYGLDEYGDKLPPPHVGRRGVRYLAKCVGHSSTVKHLDWDVDSRILQSNCNAYELLYWQADRLSPGLGLQIRHDQRDTKWATWTCINGFDVMGMFPTDYDNTDINVVARSLPPAHDESEKYLAVATDFGAVLLFNYPAVVKGGPYFFYPGHSSHVANVKWLPRCKDRTVPPKRPDTAPRDWPQQLPWPPDQWPPEQQLLVSAGGADRSIFQWRLVPVDGRAQQEKIKAAAEAAAPAPAPAQLQQSAAGAGGSAPDPAAEPQEAGAAFRSPSFLAQQERLKEQEKKLSQQDEEIALLKARLDALEAAPRPPA